MEVGGYHFVALSQGGTVGAEEVDRDMVLQWELLVQGFPEDEDEFDKSTVSDGRR